MDIVQKRVCKREMVSNVHRDEMLLVVLAATDIPLDPESVAATYDTPVEDWRVALERLEGRGDVEEVGNGLYRLTHSGREKARPRGPGNTAPELPRRDVVGTGRR